MSTITSWVMRNKDAANNIELTVFESQNYKDSGGYITVSGTDSKSLNIPVLNIGYSFNLPDKTDSEVLLLGDTSDVNHQIAIMTLPKNISKHWQPKTGGIQNPLDGDKNIEFNPKRVHIREDNVALGNKAQIEIQDNNIILRGDVIISGDLHVQGNISSKGNIECLGNISCNGSMNTSLIKYGAYIVSFNPITITWSIPPFKDYNG